ncbi:MAG: hypothetical protein LBH04_02440 [Tannerellaceae bacterium]|jgi:hypothetical protein|nr:hypothetical protein [Tannerellaceae bacterium]
MKNPPANLQEDSKIKKWKKNVYDCVIYAFKNILQNTIDKIINKKTSHRLAGGKII